MQQKPCDNVKSLIRYESKSHGTLTSKTSGEMNVYAFSPLSSAQLEEAWSGNVSNSFFETLKEQISRLPSGYLGQIIAMRKPHDKKRKDSIFDSCGYKTRFFLLEKDSGNIGKLSLAQVLLDLGMEFETPSSEEINSIGKDIIGANSKKLSICDVLWEGSHVRAGSNFTKVVSLTDAPTATWPGFVQSLFETEEDFIVSIKIKVPDKSKTRRELETKRKVTHALSVRKVDEIEDIDSGSALESAHHTLERISRGKECLSNISVAVFLRSQNTKDLDERAANLCTRLNGESGCGFFVEDLGSLLVMRSHLPGEQALEARELPLLSGNLIHFLPVFFDYNRQQSPTNLSVISRCGELCHLNLFSPSNLNFNAFVCGASGSGKSFLMNSILASFVEQFEQTRICVFDIGGSYRKLIEHLGGHYQSLNREEATKLVVGTLRGISLGKDHFAKVLIENFCGDHSNLTHSHRVGIENLINQLHGEPLRFKNLIKEADAQKEAVYQGIALWLKPFLKWDYIEEKGMFKNLETHCFKAFDFKELESDPLLQKLTIICLTHRIWDEVKQNDDHKSLIVFDEVWKFFESAASTLEEMYRTFRKYGAGIASITQNLSDYGESSFAKLVITNSFSRILLQGGGNSSLLTSALDLNKDDINRILNLKSRKNHYSELWVGTPQFSQIMRLLPNKKLFEIANSENIQKVAV